jgi:hypothetical protein
MKTNKFYCNRDKRAAVWEDLDNEIAIESTDAKKLKQFGTTYGPDMGSWLRRILVTEVVFLQRGTNGSWKRSPLFILTLPGSLVSLVLSDRR